MTALFDLGIDFDAHGEGIGRAWTVMREHAGRAGRDRPVATCPGWTIDDLVAHQGTVHRWAAASLRGHQVDVDVLEGEGHAARDQLAWLDEGARDLLQALVDAPDDLEGRFFLADAPAVKPAWARRQCHETTIHAVDAMSATSGTVPSAADVWVPPGLAADGVDELLTGFLPRRRETVRSEHPMVVLVHASDVDLSWTLHIGPDRAVTERGSTAEPGTTLTGTARELYLGLWNRGEEVTEVGAPFLRMWRDQMQVHWS